MKTVTNFELLKDQPMSLIISDKQGHTIKSFTHLKDFIDFLSLTQNIDVLDSTEKRYLQVVLKPFVNRVISVTKVSLNCGKAYLNILIKPAKVEGRDIGTHDTMCLPVFDIREMYAGMKADYDYTLEELGLFE
jgi:hypothetical protein